MSNISLQNQKLEDLIASINHISLNQQDLLAACSEFFKLYFKRVPDSQNYLEGLWDNYFFIEQSCISAREAIVLALHALTLERDIQFLTLMECCVNLDAQRYNFKEITKQENQKEQLQEYFSSLRRELFSRIYSQNKPLQKITKITPALLNERYSQFMTYRFV